MNIDLLSKASPFYPVDSGRVILDDDEAVAFYDKYPVTEGHALVVPRLTVGSLYELDPDVQTAVWQTVRRTREMLEERHRPDGFNIGINDGCAAGQTVAHAHIHIIPRYKGDVPDPRGGIRWIIPAKANYWKHDQNE